MNREVQLEVWGDLACFTRPEMKVERMTYDVPTPSAVRGILSAIYSHPSSFYWQVNRIEVLHPIRYLRFIRNEVSRKTGRIPFSVSESGNRVQRLTVALRDVRYRVAASIIRREGCPISETALYEQARPPYSRAANVIISLPSDAVSLPPTLKKAMGIVRPSRWIRTWD